MALHRLYDQSLYQFDQAVPSYWEETAGQPNIRAEPLSGSESCEVAVIGGGYAGLSAALHLARDFGVDTRVLEAGHIGWGASGRNGGFCSMGGAKMSLKRQLARYGEEETRRYYQSQVEGVNLVRTIGEEEGIDFQVQGDSEITVADTPAHFAALRKYAKVQRDVLGLDSRTISREEFLEFGYDSPYQHGALILKPTFGLHPLRYQHGLAEAAERRGAVLHSHSEVQEWRKENGRHLLVTAGGRLYADRVIVACNGYMPEDLNATLTARTLPVQTNIVVTRPLTEDELAAHQWRNEHPTINARNLFFYFRLLPDRRFLIGGRGDCHGTPAGAESTYRWLEKSIGEMWPHWKGIDITHRWRGLVCFNYTFRPAIGRYPDDMSVYFGFGFHGNGVNTATWAGRHLAYWLAGGNSGNSAEPTHLPALVRGMTPRFPFPGLRQLYGTVGIFGLGLKDKFG